MSKYLSPKLETVTPYTPGVEIGYQAVMQREKTSRTEYVPKEVIPVQIVDLDQYDKLYARESVR